MTKFLVNGYSNKDIVRFS